MSNEAKTILLVDDDAVIRAILGKMLSSQGYIVIEAENGLSAIREFRDADTIPDAIVTDYSMPPGCTGIELAREIGASCPVIIMSTDDIQKEQAIEPNIDVFIQKSVGIDAVFNAVLKILR